MGIAPSLAVRLAQAGLWGLIVLAAASGLAGLARRAPATAAVAGPTTVPSRVTGFAQSYVASFVVSGEETAGALEPFVGRVDLSGVKAQSRNVVSTSVVDAATAERDYWSVVVAVVVVDGDGARPRCIYYSVGVYASAGLITATGLPAMVPPPARASLPSLDTPSLEPPVPGDDVAGAVERFASALLAGDGEVGRYTSADSGIAAIAPPPFEHARLEALASQRTAAGRLVRAVVKGDGPTGAEVLQYELRLVQRDGQWVVASMTGAPSLATNAGRARPASGAAVTTTTAAFDPLSRDGSD